jgi:hypothetical protein
VARTRIFFAAAFALALIAGAAAGILAMRFARQPATATSSATTLDDLGLSVDQREHIKQIWEKVRDQSDDMYRQAQKLQDADKQRIVKLLTPEQLKQYQEIYNQDLDVYARLVADRKAAVKKAIQDTRSLLSASQQQKYDEILKSRLGRDAESGSVWLSAPSAATQPAKPGNSLQDLQSQVRR